MTEDNRVLVSTDLGKGWNLRYHFDEVIIYKGDTPKAKFLDLKHVEITKPMIPQEIHEQVLLKHQPLTRQYQNLMIRYRFGG